MLFVFMSSDKKTILIAEDEKPMALILERKLKLSGFEVKVTHDGEKALAAIAEGGVDLVILDLIMPKLNGFGVLEAMKKQKLKMPVIVLSNLSQDEDEARVKELGASAFFIKSNVSMEQVVKIVKYCLKIKD
jgi:two-component system alkaline phosphatase synthesis response regulator PhoP